MSGTVAASGTGTLTIRPVRRQRWTVRQVSVEAPNVGGGASGMLRKNGNAVAPFIAQADAIAGEPPIILGPGENMTIVWTGATAGAQIKALVTYDDGA